MPLLALQRGIAGSNSVPDHENLNAHRWLPNEVKDQLMQEYKHRIHTELEEQAKKVGGHGGMDFIMDCPPHLLPQWPAIGYGRIRPCRVELPHSALCYLYRERKYARRGA